MWKAIHRHLQLLGGHNCEVMPAILHFSAGFLTFLNRICLGPFLVWG